MLFDRFNEEILALKTVFDNVFVFYHFSYNNEGQVDTLDCTTVLEELQTTSFDYTLLTCPV